MISASFQIFSAKPLLDIYLITNDAQHERTIREIYEFSKDFIPYSSHVVQQNMVSFEYSAELVDITPITLIETGKLFEKIKKLKNCDYFSCPFTYKKDGEYQLAAISVLNEKTTPKQYIYTWLQTSYCECLKKYKLFENEINFLEQYANSEELAFSNYKPYVKIDEFRTEIPIVKTEEGYIKEIEKFIVNTFMTNNYILSSLGKGKYDFKKISRKYYIYTNWHKRFILIDINFKYDKTHPGTSAFLQIFNKLSENSGLSFYLRGNMLGIRKSLIINPFLNTCKMFLLSLNNLSFIVNYIEKIFDQFLKSDEDIVSYTKLICNDVNQYII